MLDKARAAFRETIRETIGRETDPAAREWAALFVRGDERDKRPRRKGPRRKRKAPARSPAAPSPKVRTRKR
jgi:hypothetical protein